MQSIDLVETSAYGTEKMHLVRKKNINAAI